VTDAARELADVRFSGIVLERGDDRAGYRDWSWFS
jgi:hypothetical protein